MPRPMQFVRQRRPDPPDPVDQLTLGDVLQRLGALNAEQYQAIDYLSRFALREALKVRDE